MKQIKTGLAGFDWFLKGGLPPKVLLLSGHPGSGNEIFARQIAFSLAKQISISYFTIHSTADSVKEDMLIHGWDVEPLEATDNWRFIEINNNASFVKKVIDEMKQHRMVVVDSLSELMLTHDIKEVTNLLTTMSLQNKKGAEFHLLLLTEGMQNQQKETTMEHFAEGVIVFNTNWNSDSTIRHILIKKLRGITVPVRRLQYNLGNKGFIIETATRIN